MTTGILSLDGPVDSCDCGDCRVYFEDAEMPGGLAGKLNRGIASLVNDGCEQVVVIGTGCTPQSLTVSNHSEILASHRYPLITCGRIIHADTRWKDFREAGNARKLGLFNRSGTIIQNPSVLKSGYGISIGNFGMNLSAIDRMARLSRTYFGCGGPFPDIPGIGPYGYGKVLSICAWCARVIMFMMPTGRNDAVMYDSEGHNPYSEASPENDGSAGPLGTLMDGIERNPIGLDFFDSVGDYRL